MDCSETTQAARLQALACHVAPEAQAANRKQALPQVAGNCSCPEAAPFIPALDT